MQPTQFLSPSPVWTVAKVAKLILGTLAYLILGYGAAWTPLVERFASRLGR
jgi:hypothetical protein